MQMYKVFNQQRAIIFTADLTLVEVSVNDSLIELTDIVDVYPVYQESINKMTHGNLIFLIKNELSSFVDKFLSHFKLIEAAGGVIMNSKGELLLINRFGKWDLPKGKIEKDEPIRAAAIRECMEETGVENVSIVRALESTYHIYEIDDKPILKQTFWFAMKTESENELIPQLEEGIKKVRWMNRGGVVEAVKNTHESLMVLIKNNYLN